MKANNVFAHSLMHSILKCNFALKSCEGDTLKSFSRQTSYGIFQGD